MQATFAALADRNRFRIVEQLRARPRTVNELGHRLSLRQPQVSKHLKVLRDAGLVQVEPKGQQRVYELRGQPLAELHHWLERYRQLWEERFASLDAVLSDLEAPLEKPHEPRKRRVRHAARARQRGRAGAAPRLPRPT